MRLVTAAAVIVLTAYLLVDVPRRVERAVADEAERVRALVGDSRFTIRFPNDLHRELSG